MDGQSVLRCPRCSKPFDKQATLKRHGYYCRSRTGPKASRLRSCVSCVRGKARCDHKKPECSRCKSRNIECTYQLATPRHSDSDARQSDDTWSESTPSLVADSPPVNTRQGSSPNDNVDIDSFLAAPDPALEDFRVEDFDWAGTDINFTTLLSPKMDAPSVQYMFDAAPSPFTFSTSPEQPMVRLQHGLSTMPATLNYNIRSLIQRPKTRPGVQRVADLVFHILRSYPAMMLRPDALPPFIHRFLVSSKHMESLENCISLLRIKQNRKLFWKNVRLECERLFTEYVNLDRWNLLAALQALSIYIVIRLEDGETEENDFDTLLVATVAAISKQFSNIDVEVNAQSTLARDTSWEDWIFEESKRRICVVYQVVNMIFYFEPAAMCDDHHIELVLAPLPCKKQLWEAGDELTWRMEIQRDAGAQDAFGLTKSGELVRLGEGHRDRCDLLVPLEGSGTRTPASNAANWAEWCAGMDGFGGLIMLAASLTG